MVVKLRRERLVRLHLRPHRGDKRNHSCSAVDNFRRPTAKTHDFFERFRFLVSRVSVLARGR